MSKNPVVHFEMPYKDAKRVSKFYQDAFGWQMNESGDEMGHYVIALTSDTDEKSQRPKNPGEINGGFYNLSNSQYPEPSVVIAVEDIAQAIEMVKKAGGEILGEVQDIPGVGLWVSFKDTEGNRASLLQPKGM